MTLDVPMPDLVEIEYHKDPHQGSIEQSDSARSNCSLNGTEGDNHFAIPFTQLVNHHETKSWWLCVLNPDAIGMGVKIKTSFWLLMVDPLFLQVPP